LSRRTSSRKPIAKKTVIPRRSTHGREEHGSVRVFGVYPSYSKVEQAVEALKAAGFRNTDISVTDAGRMSAIRISPTREARRPRRERRRAPARD
jgi:hypothetical protein